MPLVLTFELDDAFTTTCSLVIDFFFMADVIINFMTTYDNNQKLLMTEFGDIAVNYIKSWFLVGLVSSSLHLIYHTLYLTQNPKP